MTYIVKDPALPFSAGFWAMDPTVTDRNWVTARQLGAKNGGGRWEDTHSAANLEWRHFVSVACDLGIRIQFI